MCVPIESMSAHRKSLLNSLVSSVYQIEARSAGAKSTFWWVALVDCIVILHCRYKIAVTTHPIAHHQWCLGQAAAAQVLTLVGEEMESSAENQYSDKVEGYESRIKASVFNTTRQNLLSLEGVNLHTTFSQYTPASSLIRSGELPRGSAQWHFPFSNLLARW